MTADTFQASTDEAINSSARILFFKILFIENGTAYLQQLNFRLFLNFRARYHKTYVPTIYILFLKPAKYFLF